ncbi:DNA ligase [Collibacillus ludicampi]|jgi:bifunctional non-homologous end joining protein LigD|uniref:DNA ligase (ATP) n=1 Tax=Collibacillus ludicampi TaxID=2771369 RepID=A0AAV4LK01_9BACL|nr:non-homologous end-joining DNA ligase [Collibacillus ludicampi]GIM48143.1 DNA ligase [Collibacillus ludicampi]
MKPIIPMEPVSSEIIPNGENWIAQIKWDGVRVLTYFDGREVRLYNRKLNERTMHFPEILDVRSYCQADSVILDGEIIALGSDGKPSFHEVMRRDGIRQLEKVKRMQKVVPVTYMIFDIIYKDGDWLNRLPLHERSEILSKIIRSHPHVQLVSSHDHGKELFDVMRQHGMEGIVAKRADSPYVIGEKKDLWLKIKNYRDLHAVIGGFTLSGGVVNSVLLGLYDDEENLWYIGHTGTGKISREEWRALTEILKPLVVKERPFVNKPERYSDAFWVQPVITVKIKYSEWKEGRSLRQPSIQGFIEVPVRECKIRGQLK